MTSSAEDCERSGALVVLGGSRLTRSWGRLRRHEKDAPEYLRMMISPSRVPVLIILNFNPHDGAGVTREFLYRKREHVKSSQKYTGRNKHRTSDEYRVRFGVDHYGGIPPGMCNN